MNIDYDALAGTTCAGCGVGDALEILELDGEGTYHRLDGRVWHVSCWAERVDPIAEFLKDIRRVQR